MLLEWRRPYGDLHHFQGAAVNIEKQTREKYDINQKFNFRRTIVPLAQMRLEILAEESASKNTVVQGSITVNSFQPSLRWKL